MLYHFQVIWRWIILTLKRSLKVIQTGTIRKLGCCFLFAFRSNYGRIFNRLWDIQRQNIAWPWKLGWGLFKIIENGAVRWTMYDFLLVRHCKYSSVPFLSYLTLNDIMTLKSGLKVTQDHSNRYLRKLGCGLLFAFHSNCGSVLHHVHNKAIYWSKIVIFYTPLAFDPPPVRVVPMGILLSRLVWEN